MAQNYDLSDLGAQVANQNYDLSDLGAQQIQVPQQQGKTSIYDDIANILGEIGVGGAKFGANLISAPHNISQSLSKSPILSGIARKGFGEIAQEIPAYQQPDYNQLFGVQPGTAGKVLENVSQYAPYSLIGGPSLVGQAASGALAGLTQSQTPMTGAAIGAAVPGILKGGGQLIGGGIKSVASKLIPQDSVSSLTSKIGDLTDSLKSYLSKGKTGEDMARSAGSDLNNAYKFSKDQSKLNYQNIINDVGNSTIYDKSKDVYQSDNPDSYLNDKGISNTIKKFSSSLFNQHQNFIKNPTFENAHNLQSAIGKELGKLNSRIYRFGPTSPNDEIVAASLRSGRDALRTDMSDFIDNNRPDLSGKYQAASDYHKNNVVPFQDNRAISSVIYGKKNYLRPSQLKNTFSYPDQDVNVSSVLDQMPDDFGEKLLQTQVGSLKDNASPSQVINLMNNLNAKGFSSHFSPETLDKLNELNSLSLQKDLLKQGGSSSAQKLASALAGYMVGSPGGVPGEIIGALSGLKLGNKLLSSSPARAVGKSVNVAGKTYQPTADLLTAALTPTLLKKYASNKEGNK